MPQLRIRDVKEELDGTNKRLDKIRNAVYVLAIAQLGLIAYLLSSVLSQ
tara:strand:- start:10205 stop:10351 length:147 start_codon:yes stop_codon:yes gene_type:complete